MPTRQKQLRADQKPSNERRIGLYLRMSRDATGEAVGVDRQRRECLAMIKREGLRGPVFEYPDNDTSAYSGRVRPAYQRMLDDVRAGRIDLIVAWAPDRLYRQMRDLVELTDVVNGRADIRTVTGSGPIDLSTADGRLQAGLFGVVAEHESARKGERVAARARQRVEQEGRMTATRRPYGWDWVDPCPGGKACEHKPRACTSAGQRPATASRKGLIINESEAPHVRAIFDLVAKGGSVRAAARYLREQGQVGTGGAAPSAETARAILTNPRHAGLVAHHGEVVGKSADGQRIVPVRTFEKVQAILSDPTRRVAPGRPAGTPLSGIAVCGKCGGPMNASNKNSKSRAGEPVKVPVYLCSREHHLTRRRSLVDEAVLQRVGQVLARQSRTLMRRASPTASKAEQEATAALRQAHDRLDTLSSLVASGELEPRAYADAVRKIHAGIEPLRARAAVASGRPATAALLAHDDVRTAWEALVTDNVDGLRAVLREMLDRVVINVAARPGHPTEGDVEIRWAPWLG